MEILILLIIGHTSYHRHCIERHLNNEDKSPITRQKLRERYLDIVAMRRRQDVERQIYQRAEHLQSRLCYFIRTERHLQSR